MRAHENASVETLAHEIRGCMEQLSLADLGEIAVHTEGAIELMGGKIDDAVYLLTTAKEVLERAADAYGMAQEELAAYLRDISVPAVMSHGPAPASALPVDLIMSSVRRFVELTGEGTAEDSPQTAYGIIEVEMDRGVPVEAGPGEERQLRTFSLSGCVAVGIAATFPDGRRRAYIQHYPLEAKRQRPDAPTSYEELKLTKESANGRYSEASNIEVVICAPERNGRWDDFDRVSWLTEGVRRRFGPKTVVRVEGYQVGDDHEDEEERGGVLVIRIPAYGKPTFSTDNPPEGTGS